MSNEIGNNVIVIEPNTEIWDTDIRSQKMRQHFVFIGKTTSNLKNEVVNFGEYGKGEVWSDLGKHSNYVELEGHEFDNPEPTSINNYQNYFGRYVEENNKMFCCYKYDKSEIKEGYWDKLDTLYDQ